MNNVGCYIIFSIIIFHIITIIILSIKQFSFTKKTIKKIASIKYKNGLKKIKKDLPVIHRLNAGKFSIHKNFKKKIKKLIIVIIRTFIMKV